VLDATWRTTGTSSGIAMPSVDTPDPMIRLRQIILPFVAFLK